MNTNNPDNAEHRKAEALEALASQENGAPTETNKPPASEDPFSKLAAAANAEPELISDDQPEGDEAKGFLDQMAEESAQVSPELSRLRSFVGGEVSVTDDPLVVPQVESPRPNSASPSRRSAMLQANARKMHKTAFKQTMIPLLLVVGGLLILMSVVTIIMLSGYSGDDFGYLQKYGKLFIIVSLPIGAILIMGAWIFFLDVRKSSRKTR